MNKKSKIILAVLIAILLGGGGYFYLKMAKKPVQAPVNQAPKVEEIDTSNWQTYYSGPKGFEIKIPPEWSKSYEHDGNSLIPDELEFWREQVGQVVLGGPFLETGSSQLRIIIKDSDLTMEEFARFSGFYLDENTTINGLVARSHMGDQENLGKTRFGEFILIKNGRRYYKIDFSSGFDTPETTEKNKTIWKAILSTFKVSIP